MEFSHDAHAFSTPRVSFKVSDLFVELHHGLVWWEVGPLDPKNAAKSTMFHGRTMEKHQFLMRKLVN